MSVDPLADLARHLTPYRYGFNNPISFTDPNGLFESRREARRFRRENNIRGRIRRNGEGGFDIRFRGSDGYVTNTGSAIEYGVTAKRIAKRDYSRSRAPEIGTWEYDMYTSSMREDGRYDWYYRGSGEQYIPPRNIGEAFGRWLDVGMPSGPLKGTPAANNVAKVDDVVQSVPTTQVPDDQLWIDFLSGEKYWPGDVIPEKGKYLKFLKDYPLPDVNPSTLSTSKGIGGTDDPWRKLIEDYAKWLNNQIKDNPLDGGL